LALPSTALIHSLSLHDALPIFTALTPLPDDLPDRRAVLLGTLETAVNALWDGRPLYGDRVAVVGGGMVGACVTALLGRMPLTRRSEEHTSELQSRFDLVCRLLL